VIDVFSTAKILPKKLPKIPLTEINFFIFGILILIKT